MASQVFKHLMFQKKPSTSKTACLSGQAVCLLNANEPKEGEQGCKPTNLDFAQKRQNRITKKGGAKGTKKNETT